MHNNSWGPTDTLSSTILINIREFLKYKSKNRSGIISLTIFLSILIACFIGPQFSYAQGLKAAIFDVAPWGHEENGHIAGIEYEIINAISKEMGEDIDIQLVPYKRMIENLETGTVDFAIFYRSKKSEKSGEPIAKWGKLDIIVIGRAGTDILSYKDLKPLEVAVRLGGYFDPHFDNDSTLNKLSVDNYEHGIKLLMANRVDAVIGTAATLYYEFNKQGINLDQLGKPFFIASAEDWLHFSRKSIQQDKKEDLKQAVNTLVRNGRLEQIFSKYLPSKWEHF